MCFTISENNNGPRLSQKSTPECSSVSHLICGKESLANILADCQYKSNEMKYTEAEIKKISSNAAYSYKSYDEMLKKKI